MNVEKMLNFVERYYFFNTHNLLVSNIFRIFAVVFCVSYVKIQKNWFILVHFTKRLFSYIFCVIRLPVFWHWHHPLLSF